MHKKLRSTILYAIFILLFFSCSNKVDLSTEEKQWLSNTEEVKVGLFPYYPPYQFINEQGEIDGVFIDYLNELESKIGYKFKRVQYKDWLELIDDSKSRNLDIVLEIQKTESREGYLNFYAELFKSAHVIVTRKELSNISDINDLKGLKVTVPNEYSIHQTLRKKYPDLTLMNLTDDQECLEAVASGKADAYVGPKAVANFNIRKLNLNNLNIIVETKLNYEPSLAVIKDKTILNSIVKKGVNSFSLKEKQAILDNWLFNVIQPFYERPMFWIGIVWVFVILVIAMFLINLLLKYKVAEKTKALVQAKDLAEESDRLKTNFIRNISHEIRTPMTGIIGFSEALKNPDLTKDERSEFTNIIINSGKELLSTIEDILEISRLRNREIIVTPEKTNLIVLIEMLFSVYQIRAKQKGIKLILNNRLPAQQHLISIDKSKLKKILSSLIDNAIKFTEKGYVMVCCRRDENFISIDINDTGIGIPPKDIETIFNSFNQSEKEISKNYGGLGLGLTIARENSVLLGGEIELKSELGVGTTFTLKFPYIEATLTPSEDNKLEEFCSTAEGKHIVLIAEDGDVNFLFLQMILQKMQGFTFTIYRAKNGKEAVDLCEKNNMIDLVLMDIKMPIMDGYEATRAIKKIRPELKIVAQTAYSTEDDIKKALDAGCDDFLSKPVDQNKLKSVLNNHFNFLSNKTSS